MRWDPAQYARFSDERSRPFFDLTGQIEAARPRPVVDLGCGAGELTATLAQRWPAADRPRAGLLGRDDRARPAAAGDRLSFALADAADFDADGVDVLVSNALLQWVPGHRELLVRWAAQLAAGGWLAFQVPANFGAPSHRLMRELADSARWRPRLAGVLRHPDAVAEPAEYLELLAGAGLRVEAWQTSYLHVLSRPRPGAGLGPGHRPAPGAGCARRRRGGGVRRRVRRRAAAGLPGPGVRYGVPVPAHLRRRATSQG